MVQLLKFKELIYRFVGRFELFVTAGLRFIIAFVAFSMINVSTGYMKELSDYPIALLFAVICSFLPAGMMLFLGAVLILLQFYALSLELCAVVAVIFVILFCVYFRFSYRKGLYAVLTPILSVFGIPYVMPVSAGLLSEPYTVLSVICGEVVYFILKHVKNGSAMFVPGNSASIKSILTFAATDILLDKEMYLYLVAFAVTAIVVYCVRRLAIEHAHVTATAIGVAIQLGLICAGEVYLGNTQVLTRVIVGCIISVVILLVVNFMNMTLDYTRVEQLQFEDDEYYYYVKAVPKAAVRVEKKQVKQIHKKKKPRKSTRSKPDVEEIPLVLDPVKSQPIREPEDELFDDFDDLEL